MFQDVDHDRLLVGRYRSRYSFGKRVYTCGQVLIVGFEGVKQDEQGVEFWCAE